MNYHDKPNPGWAGIVVGLMIVGLGVVLLLDQTGMFGWRGGWNLWPLLVIGLGLARFIQPRPDGSREGGWLIFIGVWLLLNEMNVLRYRESWPLFLVAAGVHTMWKAVVRRKPAGPSQMGQGS
jgi:hypothetical protein